MTKESKEKCKKYSDIFRPFLDRFDYECCDAGKYGWTLIYGKNGKVEGQHYFQSEEELLNQLNDYWIFHKVMELIDQGKVSDNIVGNNRALTWLDKIPEEYAKPLREELDRLNGQVR
ncbi:MAG: hypothetical protein K6F99_02810 [Lachnospiraceae bacterium]|nr:hypothetical protein [Lachnospiraceae bacterium]